MTTKKPEINIERLFSLQGRVALITGGCGGVGRAIADGYLRYGAQVAITDQDKDQVDAMIDELRMPDTVFGCVSNVTDPGSVNTMTAAVVERFGKIDILCTAAGIARRTDAEELNPEEFQLVMDVNVKGTFLCCQAVGRDMIRRGSGGKIITIGSVRGLVGHPLGYVAYGTSKGAVHLLTRQLATEWAKYKIHVNCIAPSVVETPLANFILKTPEVKELFMSRIPFGRPMVPEELVGTAIYLASEASSFVTGQILFVDGGSVAG
jgi:gluconate 5-dehydrogenase